MHEMSWERFYRFEHAQVRLFWFVCLKLLMEWFSGFSSSELCFHVFKTEFEVSFSVLRDVFCMFKFKHWNYKQSYRMYFLILSVFRTIFKVSKHARVSSHILAWILLFSEIVYQLQFEYKKFSILQSNLHILHGINHIEQNIMFHIKYTAATCLLSCCKSGHICDFQTWWILTGPFYFGSY